MSEHAFKDRGPYDELKREWQPGASPSLVVVDFGAGRRTLHSVDPLDFEGAWFQKVNRVIKKKKKKKKGGKV